MSEAAIFFDHWSGLLSGFPGGSDDKESACNAGDPGSIPGSGRSPGEGNGNLLQYSMGFPGSTSGKEPTSQCRRHKRQGFNPWVGKIPWKTAWQSTPVFLPGVSYEQRSMAGYSPYRHKELDMTEMT